MKGLASPSRGLLAHGREPVETGIRADLNESTSAADFPTDSRVRQKEAERLKKEAGTEHIPVKRKFPCDQHWDDCGNDLRGLGGTNVVFENTDSDEGVLVIRGPL